MRLCRQRQWQQNGEVAATAVHAETSKTPWHIFSAAPPVIDMINETCSEIKTQNTKQPRYLYTTKIYKWHLTRQDNVGLSWRDDSRTVKSGWLMSCELYRNTSLIEDMSQVRNSGASDHSVSNNGNWKQAGKQWVKYRSQWHYTPE